MFRWWFRQPAGVLRVFYYVYTCESQDSKPLFPKRSFGYLSECNVATSLDESVELLSDDSRASFSTRKLLDGSSTVASVIMPDREASGRNDPVRMR